MARKKTIKFEEDFEGVLFGIISQLKDYRLCWHINKVLDFDLRRMGDIEIVHRKKLKTAIFNLYRYESDLDKWLVHFVSNKHLGEFLIPDFKQVDSFLVIRGEVIEERQEHILTSLRNISGTQLVLLIDYAGLKSRENLIFE